jgi:hypothetical protein
VIVQHKLVDESVQGRAEIMGDLSDDDPPFERRQWEITPDAIDLLLRLRIYLCPNDLILNTLSPDLLPPLEFFEEIECTPDLEAWAIQRVTHG